MAKRVPSSKKIATMLQATSMTTEELSSLKEISKSQDIADTLEVEEELQSAHRELESEAMTLSLDTTPIYESTNLEINSKLTNELEICKNRCAELLDENYSLKQKLEELEKSFNLEKVNSEISKNYNTLSNEYANLSEKHLILQEKFDREIEAYKIQLSDAEKNFEMYEENEANYKLEIKKLRCEIRNLENSLNEEKTDKSSNSERVNSNFTNSQNNNFFRNRKVPPPTNGYSSWN